MAGCLPQSNPSTNNSDGWEVGDDTGIGEGDGGRPDGEDAGDASPAEDTGEDADEGDDTGNDAGNDVGGDTGGEVCVPAEETCDGMDNDCDEVTDEGCACDFADKAEGVCAQGLRSMTGVCDAPAAYEAVETVCDGFDNDCDGAVDEGCACDFGGEAMGTCAGSTIDDQGACTQPDDYETSESRCDGVDNDCDGSTDENCTCVFGGTDVGVCASGVLSAGVCSAPATYEADEVTCDGDDNDCDGVVDEGCACDFDGSSAGVCAEGTRDGQGDCAQPATYEADEAACDGEDNDCDGITDEGCACDFSATAQGVCAQGVLAMDGTCGAPAAYEIDETACDGSDNDCDGTTDEGCGCDFGGTDVGVCSDGTTVSSGACSAPLTYEAVETACDGFDNDCDGVTDEGCACDFNGSSEGVCAGSTIDAATGACAGPAGYEPTELSCDGLDNDCDGTPDAACPAPGELIITEFIANPLATLDQNGEWIEVYNDSNRTLSLRGLVVSDSNNDLTLVGDPTVPAKSYFIIGQSADQSINGGVVVDYVHSSFFLNNTGAGDSITLTQDARVGGATIDSLTYDLVDWPIVEGHSAQLDRSSYTTSNDDFNNWCLSTAPMPAGDTGTPRADNGVCP